jgi:anaerobic magnesium-protoporphyrin IX monomethyl ester cyclase
VGTPLEARLGREGRLLGDYRGWGYRIPDARAELVFRIASVAFHQRNFAPDGIATLNMGLRYDLEILRRFHAGVCDDALVRDTVEASRAVGLSSARRLREIHAFAASVDLGDEAAIQDFTVAVARAVHRDDFALLATMKRLRAEIGARASRAERAVQLPPERRLQRGAARETGGPLP